MLQKMECWHDKTNLRKIAQTQAKEAEKEPLKYTKY